VAIQYSKVMRHGIVTRHGMQGIVMPDRNLNYHKCM